METNGIVIISAWPLFLLDSGLMLYLELSLRTFLDIVVIENLIEILYFIFYE